MLIKPCRMFLLNAEFTNCTPQVAGCFDLMQFICMSQAVREPFLTEIASARLASVVKHLLHEIAAYLLSQ